MSMVPGICGAERGRAGERNASCGVPKLKFVGAGKSDGFCGVARRGGGFGAGDGLTAGGGGAGGNGAGSAAGGGGGIGAGSAAGGDGGV
jgi:hypothetical protein